MITRLSSVPMAVPINPSSTPSLKNSPRMRRGGVPMAAIIPISRMRSYTAIIITFITAISTMPTSMTRMKMSSRSIMRAMLANGDS